VVEHLGFFLRQNDDPAGSVGKSFEHFDSYGTVQGWRRYRESNEATLRLLPLFAVGVTVSRPSFPKTQEIRRQTPFPVSFRAL
jgi:hypothetical protein